MTVTVREREVGRVVRHRVALVLYADTHVRQREVGLRNLCHGDAFYRIALVLRASRFESVVEFHIRIEWIVFGRCLLLSNRVVERRRNLRLVGEELAKLHISRHGVVGVVVGRTLSHAFLQSAEAGRGVLALHVDGAEVGELQIERALCSPTARVVELLQSKLIHPDLTTLHLSRVVAHTDDHSLHLSERRITHHRDAVLRLVGVVRRVDAVVRSLSVCLGFVALLLQAGELGEGDVEHVLLGPYGAGVGSRVASVLAGLGELQRNLVLVEVALIVGAETYEYRQLSVLKIRLVGLESVGVNEHLQTLVLSEVERCVLVHRLCLAGAERGDAHRECLLVVLHELRLRWVLSALDARRQDIVDRLLVVVLLDVHGAHHELARSGSRVVEVLLVDAPLTTHEVERSEAQHDRMLEACEEHTHEAHRGEVVDSTELLLVVAQRYAELVPVDRFCLVVAQLVGVLALVYDVVLAHLEVFGADRHAILEELLVLVERVVLVDVLHVRRRLVRCVVALGARVVVGRVALRVVYVLVAAQDRRLHHVVVGTTEIVVVVACGVSPDRVPHGRVHLALHLAQEVLIALPLLLLLVVESVEAHVLHRTRTLRCREGVHYGSLVGHLTPLRSGEVLRAVYGHAALVELLAVAQNILAHLAEVDIEVAAVVGCHALLACVDEWVEHPELDVLDVSCLEVVGVELSHHAAPTLLRIVESAVGVEVGVEVVRTALVRIVSEVQDVEHRRVAVVCALVAVGEQLADVELANVMVRQLVEIALDVARRERRRAACEERVDSVPRQARAVEARAQRRLVARLGEHRRHRRDYPRRRCRHVDGVLGVLEVVDVRGVVLRAAALSGYELRELARERDARRLCEMQEGQLVEHVREPLALLLPVDVQAPDSVAERLRSHVHLVGERLFGEVLERTRELEVLREVVLPVHAEHRLALLSVVGIAFERHVHGGAGVDDALVEDGHLATRVVDRVVGAFGERDAACRNHHRALRNVVCAERNDVSRCAAELSHEHVLVLLGNLLRHGLRRVVQLGEGVLLSLVCRHAVLQKRLVHIAAERFGNGEEHSTVRHGVTLHVVEVAVGMRLVVVVESVGSEELYECLVLHLRLGYVCEVDTGGVALELHVEAELLLLYRRGEVVDVLHHEAPVALMRIVAGVLQRLHVERLVRVGDVRRELAHLIRHAAVCVLVSHGEHLVGLQRCLQRDVAQRLVHGVLRRVEQARTLQLLVVGSAHEAGYSVEHGRGLVDVACGGVLRCHGCILRVGGVGRHGLSSHAPEAVRHAVVLAQVGEGDDVTGVGCVARLVRHPHLHAVDRHARREVGQRAHRLVVAVVEVLREEEVAVLLVVGGVYLERRELLAALRRHRFRRRLLLRGYELQLELAELQVGAQTEERGSSAYERRVGGERHVACLDELHYLVFLAVVLQLEALRVEVERSVGVVVEVHVHLVAHASVKTHVYLLVEVHRGGLAVAHGQRRVVDALHRGAELQLGCSLRLDAHTAWTEYLLSRSEVEVHVGEVKLLLALSLVDLVVLLAEELVHHAALAPLAILVLRHHERGVDVRVGYLRTDDVSVERVVVHHVLLQVVGTLQVGSILVEVVERDGQRALYLPARMQQRVGYRVLVLELGLRLHDERVDAPSGAVTLRSCVARLAHRELALRVLRRLRDGIRRQCRHNHYDDKRAGSAERANRLQPTL